jgi:hypothetical protein
MARGKRYQTEQVVNLLAARESCENERPRRPNPSIDTVKILDQLKGRLNEAEFRSSTTWAAP